MRTHLDFILCTRMHIRDAASNISLPVKYGRGGDCFVPTAFTPRALAPRPTRAAETVQRRSGSCVLQFTCLAQGPICTVGSY